MSETSTQRREPRLAESLTVGNDRLAIYRSIGKVLEPVRSEIHATLGFVIPAPGLLATRRDHSANLLKADESAKRRLKGLGSKDAINLLAALVDSLAVPIEDVTPVGIDLFPVSKKRTEIGVVLDEDTARSLRQERQAILEGIQEASGDIGDAEWKWHKRDLTYVKMGEILTIHTDLVTRKHIEAVEETLPSTTTTLARATFHSGGMCWRPISAPSQ